MMGVMSELIWLIVAVVLMIPGFVGLFIPIFPGIPFMFLVALTFAAVTGFDRLVGNELSILAIIALASIAVDYLSGVLGAKFSGASGRALGAGFLGMLVGLVILPPFGGLIGLFVGVLAVELRSRTEKEALRAATGSLLGALSGILVNCLLAILFIVLFIVFALR